MDEMTKKAIDTMKKARKEPESPEVLKAETTEQTEQIEPVKETPKKSGLNKVILGPSKEVTIKPWTGKTKKKMRKIFEFVEDPRDLDLVRIIDTLVYDQVQEDLYLNEGEHQYLIALLKKISISNNVETVSECPECGRENKIHSTIDEIINYRENNLPGEYNEYKFIDIPNRETLQEAISVVTESEDYDGYTSPEDIEVALHIQIGDKDIKDVIEYLDDLPVDQATDVFEHLGELLPECKLELTKNCSHCLKEVTFPVDIMQDIFQTLLK